jgi:hypothetical protein
MSSIEERLERAQRHVEWGRFVILRQKKLIENLKAEDRDTTAADQLLEVLERTQKAFEYDLADLERRSRSLSGSG